MNRLYYGLWVDCIKRIKAQPLNKNSWRWKCMVSMSVPMIFNFVFIMSILQRHIIGYYFYKIEFKFLTTYWSNIVSFFLIFILPVIVLNYFLIFRKERYKKILEKYPYRNGVFFITYLIVSLFLPIVLLFVGSVFF